MSLWALLLPCPSLLFWSLLLWFIQVALQIRAVCLPKSKPTQPVPFDECPAPTHTPRYSICITPCYNPARSYSAFPARRRHTRCPYPHTKLFASLWCHCNSSHLLLTHRSGSGKYHMVELCPHCGGFAPLPPLACFPGKEKHIATRGVEV